MSRKLLFIAARNREPASLTKLRYRDTKVIRVAEIAQLQLPCKFICISKENAVDYAARIR